MLVPIRSLGKNGVNTDVDPFSLPPETFTMAVNARFHDSKITRGPLFKLTGPVGTFNVPRYTMSFLDNTGRSHLLIGHDNGTYGDWSSTGVGQATSVDRSYTGYTPALSQSPITGCLVNNVVYMNRADATPWYMATNGTAFAPMPNGWDASWRCGSIRTIAGVLVALNVSKGGTNYPTMVKTSDFSTFGSPPNAWVAAASNSATENVLPMISEAIVDGWPMRDSLMLYTAHNTVLMEPTYTSSMFSYKLLFNTRGVINQNCVVDRDNIHYVFGSDDIWAHDGYNPKSLAAGRVRKFIYDNMVSSQKWQFFAVHNYKLDEVLFCYVSRDEYCAFPASINGIYFGCNRAAVYNYRSDTWYFYDLPYLTSACIGPPSIGQSYDGIDPATFDQIAGSYSSFVDVDKLALLTVTQTTSTPQGGAIPAYVRTFEPLDSVTAKGIHDTVCSTPVFLENSCIDLDQVTSEIRGYKVIRSLYPQGRFKDQTAPLTFSLGSADYANFPSPTYSDPVTFDGSTQYKLDYMTAGRFLSMRIGFASPTASFTLSGMDVDMVVTGHR